MDLNSLRDALHRQPFRPFTLRLADGREVPVKHPEFVALTPRIVIVVSEDSHVSFIEPLLIASLEVSNGAGGKRRRKKPPEA